MPIKDCVIAQSEVFLVMESSSVMCGNKGVKCLTSSGMNAGHLALMDVMIWTMSTFPSFLAISSMARMVMKVPVRPTPSLVTWKGDEGERNNCADNMTHDGETVTHLHMTTMGVSWPLVCTLLQKAQNWSLSLGCSRSGQPLPGSSFAEPM